MKRLNVKLAIWLVAITIVSLVSVHFLHAFQVNRNADVLRRQAERSEEDGKVEDAIRQYDQYLRYRDDRDGYSKLAKLVVAAADDIDAKGPVRARAYNVLSEAIRRHPDLDDVRRRLVDYTLGMRQFADTLDHIEHLTRSGVKDSSLGVKAAQCYMYSGDENSAFKKLCEILAFDANSGVFQAEAGQAADQVDAYAMLAAILLRRRDSVKADDVMLQCVKVNADTARAHLVRANFLNERNTPESREEAKQELSRAYEIAPEDLDVIMAVARQAILDKDFARAQTLLDGAVASHPKRQEVYLWLAELARAQQLTKQIVEYLQQGVKNASDARLILPALADFQLEIGDLDGVRATCKKMTESMIPLELIRFSEARVEMAERDYTKAARELEAIRPALARGTNPTLIQQLDILLGQCYEQLGQPDRQLEVYRRLVRSSPDLLFARLGEASAMQALGMHADAERDLALMAADAKNFPFVHDRLLQMLVVAQSAKPAEERDWTEVDKLVEMICASGARNAVEQRLLRADILMMKNRLDEARDLLQEANAEDPKDIRVWMGIARLLVRQNQADRISRLIERATEQTGDVWQLHAQRISMVTRAGGPDAVASLKELEAGVNKYSEDERAILNGDFANAYLQLGAYADGMRCMKLALTQNPLNDRLRQTMFELAADNRDEVLMNEMLKDMREKKHLGSNAPLTKYCEAVALVLPLETRAASGNSTLSDDDRKALAEARRLVDEGISQRREWSPLWRVRGEIEQLEGNIDGAISNYQKALAFNRVGQPSTARRLSQLLYATRRYGEFAEAFRLAGPMGSDDLLRKMEQHVQVITGDTEVALASAKKDVEASPKNPVAHMFYAQILNQTGRSEEAEVEFREAVKVGPELPQTWELLVRFLVSKRRNADAVEAARRSSESLTKNPVALGTLFQIAGELDRAKHYFQQAIDEKPGEIAPLRRMAEFLLATQQPAECQAVLAKIIDRTSAAKTDADWNQLTWARRTSAVLGASPPDYQHVVAATKQIEQNAKDGKLAPADIRAIIDLLSMRRELDSRNKAQGLLEMLQKQQGLSNREQLLLGRMYANAGSWERGKRMMLSAVAQQGADVEMILAFAQILIQHEEYGEAEQWLDKADAALSSASLPPLAAEAGRRLSKQLRALALAKTGQMPQAVSTLVQLVQNPLLPAHYLVLEEVVTNLEQLEQYEPAESLLRDYAAIEPRGRLPLAGFLGRRGQVNVAFDMFAGVRSSEKVQNIVPLAMDILRRYPREATPDRFRLLEDWIKTALEVEADSNQIKLVLAELYDLQDRQQEAIKLYREILASKDADLVQVAIVQNNLAYLLALHEARDQDALEAVKLTDKAIAVIGPTPELLDTRGLAYLAAGDVPRAVTDLRIAASDLPTATKYIHLARAEKQAGNQDAARDAITKAKALSSEIDRLSAMERRSYQQLLDQLQ